MSELLGGILGGGALVSLIVAVLQYYQKQKGTNIDWYDRAVAQVKMQDETIAKLKTYISKLEIDNQTLLEENEGLKNLVEEMEQMVLDLEKEKEKMVDEIIRSGRNGDQWKKH